MSTFTSMSSSSTFTFTINHCILKRSWYYGSSFEFKCNKILLEVQLYLECLEYDMQLHTCTLTLWNMFCSSADMASWH
ncbi:hypothetical protein LIER_05046 [Lithospermum erythrorhizon]|uniref:Uncharacterized protein n=1 Tax=Lithospermum erythrorhizon TaxID=34254 RepID=A0AAV3P0A1_LITER